MATVDTAVFTYRDNPWLVTKQKLSSVQSDEPLDLSTGGPTGTKVDRLEVEMITEPTNRCVWSWHRETGSDDTSADTFRLRILAEEGGDLAGAEFNVYAHFQATGFKSGGRG